MTQLSREYVSRHFFGPTILDMRLRVTLVEIANRTVDIPDPENIRATFRISLITCLQAELCIFPVLEPPYWISEWTPHKWTRPDKWTPGQVNPDKWTPQKWTIPRNWSSRSIESIDDAESRVESNWYLGVDRVDRVESIDCVDLDFLRTHYSSRFYTSHNTLYTVRVRPSLLSDNSMLLPYSLLQLVFVLVWLHLLILTFLQASSPSLFLPRSFPSHRA